MQWKRIALMAAVAVTLGFPALAQRPTPARHGACAEDVQKFCADVKPGRASIASCLKQHEAELSPACKSHRESRQARRGQVRQACQTDVEQFCKGIAPGSGIRKCLKQHEAELSAGCKAGLAQGRQGRKAHRQP